MLYDSVPQFCASISLSAASLYLINNRAGEANKRWLRWLCVLSAFQATLVLLVQIGLLINGLFGAFICIAAEITFFLLSWPAVIYFGADEVIEKHGVIIPTLSYTGILVFYCWTAWTVLWIFERTGRQLKPSGSVGGK